MEESEKSRLKSKLLEDEFLLGEELRGVFELFWSDLRKKSIKVDVSLSSRFAPQVLLMHSIPIFLECTICLIYSILWNIILNQIFYTDSFEGFVPFLSIEILLHLLPLLEFNGAYIGKITSSYWYIRSNPGSAYQHKEWSCNVV